MEKFTVEHTSFYGEDFFYQSKIKPKEYIAKNQSIYQLLKEKAKNHGESFAVCAPEQPSLTYRALLEQAEVTLAALRNFGIKPNDRVAVVLPNGPEMAVAFLSLACGATCAPLNPSYRDSEFDFYLTDLRAKALLIWSDLESPARSVALKHKIQIIEMLPKSDAGAGTFELFSEEPCLPVATDFAAPEDTALVLHTSGTTSRPKIVPLSNANLCRSAENIVATLELSGRDCCLNMMPLFHIHGLIAAVLSSIYAGASVFCTTGFNAQKFVEWFEIARPSWFSAVPTMHQAILSIASENYDIFERSRLRFIRSSSASLPPKVMVELEKTFGVPVIEAYGMTEASHQMTSNQLPPAQRKVGSVGVAAGPDLGIMDETGNLLPAGEVGEVVIRGKNVTSGYESNPEANQNSFTKSWFRTGDQGRFDEDGYLFLTGRLKEIINRGGEKIAPKEVDEVLLQHQAVAQVVTFAVPHSSLGEDVAAGIVLKNDIHTTEEEIREFAATRLAEYKVPRQVLFLDEIPKGPTGKLQRIGLADKLKDKLNKEFMEAENNVGKELVDVWREILDTEVVGVRDNFFFLGGDSLSTITMLSEIEERFNKAIPIDRFLKSPTIETLSSIIESSEAQLVSRSAIESMNSGRPIKDTLLIGLKNRLLQILSLYAPGFKIRTWLHRMRGVSMGDNVTIGLGTLIETAYPKLVSVGNNVSIGMRVVIIGHLRDLTAQSRTERDHTVYIEDNAYIGPGVIILPNVTIGHGSVVSAGSVVSKSVPPQTLVRGNPAIPIARCGLSLGGGISYEQFLRKLVPLEDDRFYA